MVPGAAITLPFTLDWTGGDTTSVVTVQLVAHIPGQLALPLLESTSPASAGTRTLALPPAAAAFKFPQQADDVEVIVTQQPAQAPSQAFHASGLTLGGEQAWNYVFDFQSLALR